MDIILTICSKNKNTSRDLLPAYKRYTSPRIKQVMQIAESENKPFLILSGVYGLIKFDTLIPYYDHLLTTDEVDKLSILVANQINENKIKSIDFYAKPKSDKLIPYYNVIEKACINSKISLKIYIL